MNPALRAVLLSSSVDPDAKAWKAAATANGGSVSGATLSAVSAFCKSAKASGYWTKLNRINLFCGDQLAACLVPLKVGGGSATDTNVNFVAGDYTEATGLTGNGSTKKLTTGLIPSASLTLNDTHLAVYNRAASVTGAKCHIGADSAAGRFSLFAPENDGNAYSVGQGSSQWATGATAAPYGFYVGSRTSSTSSILYENGSSLATFTTANTGTLPTVEVYVFAENNSGAGGSSFTSHPLAMYSIGSGLTGADVTAYNTHIQAFQQALGRNV